MGHTEPLQLLQTAELPSLLPRWEALILSPSLYHKGTILVLP